MRFHCTWRYVTLHYIRQHKIRLRKHTCHIFTMYIFIYIYTQIIICACVFFWTPPPKKKHKKNTGCRAVFTTKKKTQREVLRQHLWFPQPGIMDFRGEVLPPPASKIDSSGRLLINLFGFLTKHPGFQLLVVDVIGK